MRGGRGRPPQSEQRADLKGERQVVRFTLESRGFFWGVDVAFASENIDHQLTAELENFVTVLETKDHALTHETDRREYLVVVEVLNNKVILLAESIIDDDEY